MLFPIQLYVSYHYPALSLVVPEIQEWSAVICQCLEMNHKIIWQFQKNSTIPSLLFSPLCTLLYRAVGRALVQALTCPPANSFFLLVIAQNAWTPLSTAKSKVLYIQPQHFLYHNSLGKQQYNPTSMHLMELFYTLIISFSVQWEQIAFGFRLHYNHLTMQPMPVHSDCHSQTKKGLYHLQKTKEHPWVLMGIYMSQ